ncbi:MAG: phosphoribosyl-AMP cyclohydrolase [Gemmatimonadaceae bacterium]|nr:phosphoribosyl-AMP cyclohydrolase [Gemmatimonadaceae bacterium]
MLNLDTLDFAKGGGFVTVVCQDARTQAVLMVARADREALTRTVTTGEMHYHSRTRGLWHKGATSGHVQHVVSLHADCDGDAVLALVTPAGPACHTGARSCFFQGGEEDAGGVSASAEEMAGGPPQEQPTPSSPTIPHQSIPAPTVSTADAVLAHLATTIAERAAALPLPAGVTPSYTQRLLSDRNLRLKKLGEEAAELAVACADEDRPRAAEEAGDIVYHTLVALAAIGVTLDDLTEVLQARSR